MVEGYETSSEAGEEVDAREARPLAVRLEQRVGFFCLDAPAPESGRQLDEAEIPRQATFVAAESLERDDADRPRPEAALTLQSPRDDVGREQLQPFEVEPAAEPDEGSAASCPEPEIAEPRG